MAEEHENIEQFEAAVKTGVFDPHPYDRLMIYYRKEKRYGDELKIIDKAIKLFSGQLKRQQSEMFKGVKSRSTIQRLSKQISHVSGLADKKGNANYIPEPLARWMKRKATVTQKIKKQK